MSYDLSRSNWLYWWLRGTTCNRPAVRREVMLENETHVVLRHRGHSEHRKHCGSYARLYEKARLLDNSVDCLGWPALKVWEGRLVESHIRAQCLEIGVVF